MLEGIDVSRYQTSTPSLAGRSFLIARASIGIGPDPMYATHIANARRAGLVVGAYHFGRNDLSIAAQVEAFLDEAGDVDLYALDVEGERAPSVGQTKEFIHRADVAGVPVGLYASESAYFEAGQAWRWVANWSRPPRIPWDIWQHRGAPLDLDRFDGSIDELRALAGGDPMQLPITDQRPMLVTLQQPADFWDLDGKLLSSGHRVPGTLTSPYRASNGTNHFRAIYAGPDPVRLVLIKPATIDPPPAPDCAPVEHELELARGRISQAITDLGGTP